MKLQILNEQTIIDNEMVNSDTIFALSTCYGKSGVAVFRISGKLSLTTLKYLGLEINKIKPRFLHYSPIFNQDKSEIIDHVLLSYFKSPHSFTGEDVVEIYSHGSIAVINDILVELSNIPNIRPAEPGEFTRLAFANDKMDLIQVEALADLIDAETSMERKIAIEQFSGNLNSIYENWRSSIVKTIANLEAYLDFPEEDIPSEVLIEGAAEIEKISQQIDQHLNISEKSQNISHGINIAIIGQPNVGKSTLINLMSQQDIAITSNIPGTTRDVLQVKLQIEGYPVLLYDTAGIRNTNDLIEKEGVKKAKKTADLADIILLIVDLAEIINTDSDYWYDQIFFDHDFVKNKDNKIILFNKYDLLSKEQKKRYHEIIKKLASKYYFDDHLIFSSVQNLNIDALFAKIKEKIAIKCHDLSATITTKVRQKTRIQSCLAQLQKIKIYPNNLEITLQDLRFAVNDLAVIIGKIETDEILEKIFSSFCIGK